MRPPDDHGTADDHGADGYRGPASVRTADAEIDVDVVLRGYFEPIDGRFHRYGRISAHADLTAAARSSRRTVVLRTPYGEAAGTLSDPDPWQRYRITGTGRPPFDR